MPRDVLHAIVHGRPTIVAGNWKQAPLVSCSSCGEPRTFGREVNPFKMLVALVVAAAAAGGCIVLGSVAVAAFDQAAARNIGLVAAIVVFGVLMAVANHYVTVFEPVTATAARASRRRGNAALSGVLALVVVLVAFRLLR